MPSGAPISSATATSTRSAGELACSPVDTNTWMGRGPLSTRYIVRPSGLHPQAVGDRQTVVGSSRFGRSARLNRYSAPPSAWWSSAELPAQEPPPRIAGAVVHPRPLRRDLGERAERAVRRQVDEAAAGGDNSQPSSSRIGATAPTVPGTRYSADREPDRPDRRSARGRRAPPGCRRTISSSRRASQREPPRREWSARSRARHRLTGHQRPT